MEKSKTIAVLGGGHGGHTMAADLTMKGFEVRLCEAPEFVDNIKVTLENQAITLIDANGKRHVVKPKLVTTDFKEALDGTGYIMIVVPAVGSKLFFKSIMPYLEDGQTIIKWSANFSALMFANMLKQEGIQKDITLAETHTLPWGCRLVKPGTAQIMVWAVKLLLSTLPTQNLNPVLKDVETMYPVVPGENVLSTTLNNLNPVVHPVGTIMNAGSIDAKGKDFYLYRDGTTQSILKGIRAVFEEVSRIAAALGIMMLDYPEKDFMKKSTIMSTYFEAPNEIEKATDQISGPSSFESRYILEDLPFGLVPMTQLARQCGIETPTMDGIIALANIINQTDYRKIGLTLEELGIPDFDRESLKNYLG
jgi:opine dehydrogenase